MAGRRANPGRRVRANVEDAASEDVYPFYDAIGRRDAADALGRLERLFSDRPVRAGKRDFDPDPYAWPVIFLGMVTTEVRRMLLSAAFSTGRRLPCRHALRGVPGEGASEARGTGRALRPLPVRVGGAVTGFLWYKAAERAARYSPRSSRGRSRRRRRWTWR